MKKPTTIEEAQFMLEKKGYPRNIVDKIFFSVPVKIIKLRDNPKEYIVGVNEPFLKGLTSITKNNFEAISGSGTTIAYLARAFFLIKRKTENRKYPNLSLKFLFFTKAIAELQEEKFIPVIDTIINKKIIEALTTEDKDIINRDIEDFKELAEELKKGFEEYI
jgi:hypothetical protein